MFFMMVAWVLSLILLGNSLGTQSLIEPSQIRDIEQAVVEPADQINLFQHPSNQVRVNFLDEPPSNHDVIIEIDNGKEGNRMNNTSGMSSSLMDPKNADESLDGGSCFKAEDCAICSQRCTGYRDLPCGHSIHRSCAKKWLSINPTCPFCRQPVPDEGVEKCAQVTRVSRAERSPSTIDVQQNMWITSHSAQRDHEIVIRRRGRVCLIMFFFLSWILLESLMSALREDLKVAHHRNPT
ncbi:hypothetical protein PGT21_021193 [Puccinia graminis f. sp. tritici]|uniref:RING-type domain-containing protein n=1 Tax=Puccinia graminis f. sp. tritici TaxID=56615 RepID=A0A5B0M269_PUCGR|nr:hypothetical protein PGT21_021193 [Puccinia graminis f. sp. tritici]